MLYILRRNRPMRNGHPAYVVHSGSHKSYTSSLKRARVFASRRAAESEACGNEVVIEIEPDGQLALFM